MWHPFDWKTDEFHPNLEDCIKVTVNMDVGNHNALYLTGEVIGKWKTAFKLTCIKSNEWIFYAYYKPHNWHRSVSNTEFKFMVGRDKIGDTPETKQLSWMSGENLKFSESNHILKYENFPDYYNVQHRPVK